MNLIIRCLIFGLAVFLTRLQIYTEILPPVLFYEWGSYGRADGQFNRPYGMAIGPDGLIYLADYQNHRIQVFKSDGAFVRKWGGSGSGDGQFRGPASIAISSDGLIYVGDSANHRIQVFKSDGAFVRKWGSRGDGDGQFYYAHAVVIDSDGLVYVADYNNHRVQVFESDGTFVRKWGSRGAGDGRFNRIGGIALDQDEFVYVADHTNHRIQVFESDGTFVRKWGGQGSGDGQFRFPDGIAICSRGLVYVADTGNYRIQVFKPDGTFVCKWGRKGGAGGQFDPARALAISADDRVYVSDDGNHRVQVFVFNLEAPPAPSGVSASDRTYRDKVRVTWNPSANASGYTVYRNTREDAVSADILGSTFSTAYDDKAALAGITYYYWIKATNAAGPSAFSSPGRGRSVARHILAYSAGANGSISGTASQIVNHGASGAQVTAVPDVGSHFVRWNDGSTTNPRRDINVTGDISVIAIFAINKYTLAYNAGINGSISGITPQIVNHGGNGSHVTAVPDTESEFIRWSDGSAANPRRDVNVTANITVTAEFRINPPVTPTGVSASDGDDSEKIRVTWNRVKGAASYEIWRRAEHDPGASARIVSGVTDMRYDDADVSPGTTYYYWIKAVNSSGTSGFSLPASGSVFMSDISPPE